MLKIFARVVPLVLVLTLVAAACGSDDDGGNGGSGTTTTTATATPVDYESIGLWDDGQCDPAKPELKLGLMTVFESPVLSLKDQADALVAAAEAFNERGGANGSCIEITTCDDGGTIDQAVACVKTLQQAGVVATVNDQGTAGQAEVSSAMQDAKIPRVAANVSNADWGDPNAYPLDASGTGSVFLLPQALINNERNKVGIVRVDLAAASAMQGLLEQTYEGDATFPYDAPIPGGTTDFTQFILGAQNAGSDSIMLASGEQEALQVVNAGEQLSTDLKLGATLGSFPHKQVSELGDFADQMVFLWAYPPATYDLPAYEALRADLAASGNEQLQPDNLKASPMRSWIGLYALLKMMRDAKMTEFTGEGITAMLKKAKNVPMLGIYGDENWTPDTNHPGLYKRAGTNHWATYTWDPDATAEGGLEGNFVESSTMSFDETLCGSIFGAPKETC